LELRTAAATLMVRIEEARESPLGLFRLMFISEKGAPGHIEWFHDEWNQLFLDEEISQFIISAARGLGKTAVLLFAVAWAIGKNPNLRVRWLSADANTAIKRLAVLHSIVDAPIYQLVFPSVRKLTAQESRDEKRPNSATQLNVRRDFRTPEPTIEASGILSSGVGGRADLIVCDDVVSESNALLNPTMRPKVISKFISDWLATLVADGRVWYIGSPWHRDDLLAYLKSKPDWTFKQYAHGKPGDPYHSIFPALWPRKRLEKRRADFGPLHYARAYLCQPFTDETVAIRPASLKLYTREHLSEQRLFHETTAVISLDPSSGKDLQKGKLDYTGVTIFLVWQRGEQDGETDEAPIPGEPDFQVYIPTAFQVKLPHVDQARLAWQLVRQWDAAYLLVEAEGMQSLHSWLEQERLRDPTLPLVDIHATTSGNLNKGQRLVRISPLIELPASRPTLVRFSMAALQVNPQTYYVDVNGTPFEALNDLYGQITSFPTQHDDILDSFTGGLHWIHANLIGLPHEDGEARGAPSIASFAI